MLKNREALATLNARVDALRSKLHLSDDFEFHFAYNINPAKAGFIKLLASSDLEFIVVAIKKNHYRSFGSYANLAKYLAAEIIEHYPAISIEMDSNPILHKELRQNSKSQSAKIRLKQMRSRGHNLIQCADYIVALATRSLKKPSKCASEYAKVSAKCRNFITVK